MKNKTYLTVQGDMWDGIAKKTLGSESFMSKLIEANITHSQTVIFPANVTLVIPEIITPVSSTLPPWKRGGSA